MNNAVEYLYRMLQKHGIKVHRLRPNEEQSWIGFRAGGIEYEAKQYNNKNCLAGKIQRRAGYSQPFLFICFTKNSIRVLDDILCIGTKYGWVFIEK